jgi:nitrate reductase gamma subunit
MDELSSLLTNRHTDQRKIHMTALSDILNVDLLLSHVADGNVRSQAHPEFKRLRIFNYTEKCTWDKAWDSVTLQCRAEARRANFDKKKQLSAD